LLNHILSAAKADGRKLAVIANEYGKAPRPLPPRTLPRGNLPPRLRQRLDSIDEKLLAQSTKSQFKDEIIEVFSDGCICCTFRKDLVDTLSKFAKRIKSGLKLDGVIIETTGMAKPAPLAQTFFVNDKVKEFFRLDGLITVIDAKHIEQHLDAEMSEGTANESVEQLAFADRMVLNKTDLVTEADLTRVEARLRAINKFAPIQRCTKSHVSVDSMLNIRGFDLRRTLDMVPGFLHTNCNHPPDQNCDDAHDKSVSSFSIRISGDVDLASAKNWLGDLLRSEGDDIYRMRGVLAVARSELKFLCQAVHALFSGDFDQAWSGDEVRESRFLFIGKNLNRETLEAGLRACVVTPEFDEVKSKTLRFAIGERVKCNTHSGWKKGKVVAHQYRDEYMDPGVVAPYQVKLANGELIYAPVDCDDLIRKA
jgi:G3E family GTPase